MIQSIPEETMEQEMSPIPEAKETNGHEQENKVQVANGVVKQIEGWRKKNYINWTNVYNDFWNYIILVLILMS